jgi:hypothetical protein
VTRSAVVEDTAKWIVRGFVQSGVKPDDVVDQRTLKREVHFPVGQIRDIPAAMDYAAGQGWLRKISDDEYRLTAAGFTAGS